MLSSRESSPQNTNTVLFYHANARMPTIRQTFPRAFADDGALFLFAALLSTVRRRKKGFP